MVHITKTVLVWWISDLEVSKFALDWVFFLSPCLHLQHQWCLSNDNCLQVYFLVLNFGETFLYFEETKTTHPNLILFLESKAPSFLAKNIWETWSNPLISQIITNGEKLKDTYSNKMANGVTYIFKINYIRIIETFQYFLLSQFFYNVSSHYFWRMSPLKRALCGPNQIIV